MQSNDFVAERHLAEGKTRELRRAAWKSSISVYNGVDWNYTLESAGIHRNERANRVGQEPER